ncbi:hypothetical protein [Flammeovirga sp. SJP92]|uniref:hypothetical protein n=1 Tax=Flammeovirga sp. SJP92 TaxID=1775430 RepID=UPI0012FBEB2F|nr:hypothetical protein [Flammeovirga sp. SJP92]
MTAFITVYFGGIGKIWVKPEWKFNRSDTSWIIGISTFAILSFGSWALTLAGGIISTSGTSGFTIPVNNVDALTMARIFMSIGYWAFIGVLITSGLYYYRILIKLKEISRVS